MLLLLKNVRSLKVFRYFFLSAILHIAIFGLLSWKQEPVIYDGILAVEFSPSKTPQVSANTQKNLVKNQKEKIPEEKSNTEDGGIENRSTIPSATSASNTPLESANVTTNPRVLKQVKASYPQEAKEAGIQGAVKLSVIIDPTGHVQEVKVLEGPGYGLNETAQEALKQFIFSPAELHGEKVSVRIVYIYRFRLDTR